MFVNNREALQVRQGRPYDAFGNSVLQQTADSFLLDPSRIVLLYEYNYYFVKRIRIEC